MSSEPDRNHPFYHIGTLEQMAREIAREHPESVRPKWMLARLEMLAEILKTWGPREDA